MSSLTEFAQRIKVIAKGVETNADRIVKQAAIAIDQTVVLATPVDTGRARSNWLTQAGYPRRDTIDPYAAGKGLGKSEGANAQAAIQQGLTAITAHKSGQDIYISNNLPYIQKLNDGHSAQAPAGFVEKAIQSGVRAVRKAKLVP